MSETPPDYNVTMPPANTTVGNVTFSNPGVGVRYPGLRNTAPVARLYRVTLELRCAETPRVEVLATYKRWCAPVPAIGDSVLCDAGDRLRTVIDRSYAYDDDGVTISLWVE